MRASRFGLLALLLPLSTSGAAHAEDAKPAEASSAVLPEPAPKKLSFVVGAGSIDSPGAAGGAIWTGLRLSLGRHLAASADFGYGLAGTAPSDQDRWWVIPTLALVIPTSPARFELGLGAGVGTSSGYRAWSEYFSTPFLPEWHDTVPVVRAHASAARQLTPNVDLFARAELASLLFAPEHDGTVDTLWLALWVGFQIGLL